jgi:hypothetical protein
MEMPIMPIIMMNGIIVKTYADIAFHPPPTDAQRILEDVVNDETYVDWISGDTVASTEGAALGLEL